jgi:calcineurin-like phosphoesterase family protein
MTERTIWVISDTHFNHQNIIKYCGRPFETAKEMNECMVENWNAVVKPQDKVYHLGDVYMGGGFSREYTLDLLCNLNGHKRLILGNHDNGKDQILQKDFEKIDVWRMFPEFGLLLTHIPMHESGLYRGDHRAKGTKKLRNIHGHIHEKVVKQVVMTMTGIQEWYEEPDPNYECLCVEHTDYRPVNIETLRKW